jgi:hypothetical protein
MDYSLGISGLPVDFQLDPVSGQTWGHLAAAQQSTKTSPQEDFKK